MVVTSCSTTKMELPARSEEHTSELQSLRHLVCRLLLVHPPASTLFPYTTLFRSTRAVLEQVATRLRLGYLCEAFGRAAVEDATPTLAGPGAYIHQPVCALHGGHVMLDHEDGIASEIGRAHV